MPTINDPRPGHWRRARVGRGAVSRLALGCAIPTLVARAVLAVLLLAAGACGGRETATLRRDVRLELSHDPPASAPAGQPFILTLRVVADPALDPGSAHLWYEAGEGWSRLQLEPMAGTDRLEAEIPAQPRGRILSYFFVVTSALGEPVRLPKDGVGPAGELAPAARDSAGAGQPAREGQVPAPGTAATAVRDVYELPIRAPVAAWATWLAGVGAVLSLLLVAGGATLAARWRPAEPPGRPAGVTLAALGSVLFVVAIAGAVVASFQATGNPLREVPLGWWVALGFWLPILLVARALRRQSGSPARARRLALLAVLLAVPGVAGVLLGLGRAF